jgi:hypothetical protein
MSQAARIFHRAAVWQQNTLSAQVESVHHGFRIVVTQNANDGNRISREASQHQSLNFGGANRSVFAV